MINAIGAKCHAGWQRIAQHKKSRDVLESSLASTCDNFQSSVAIFKREELTFRQKFSEDECDREYSKLLGVFSAEKFEHAYEKFYGRKIQTLKDSMVSGKNAEEDKEEFWQMEISCFEEKLAKISSMLEVVRHAVNSLKNGTKFEFEKEFLALVQESEEIPIVDIASPLKLQKISPPRGNSTPRKVMEASSPFKLSESGDRKEIQELKSQILMLQEKIQILQNGQAEHVKNESEAGKEELKLVLQKYEDSQKELREISQKYEELQKEDKELLQKYENSQKKEKEISQKYEQSQKKEKEMLEKIELNKESDLLQKLEDSQRREKEVQKNYEDSLQKEKEILQKYENLKKEFQRKENDILQKFEDSQKEVGGLKKDMEGTKKMLGSSIVQNEVLKKEAEKLKKESEKYKKEAESLKKELDKLQKETEVTKLENSKLKKELEKDSQENVVEFVKNSELAEMPKKEIKVQAEINSGEEIGDNFDKQSSKLGNNVEMLSLEYEEKSQLCDLLQSELATTKKKLENLQNLFSELNTKMENTEQEKKSQILAEKEGYLTLKKEKEELEQKLTKITQNEQNLHLELQQKNSQIQTLMDSRNNFFP